MHQPQRIFKAFLRLSIILLPFTFTSCQQKPKIEDPKEIAEEENKARFQEAENAQDNADALIDASEFDLSQKELGKLAQVKSKSVAVQALAQMMENHHDELFNELALLAKTKQISIPNSITEEGQDDYNKLNKVAVNNFDKEYLNAILIDHKNAIEEFSKEAKKSNDPDIKAYLDRKVSSLTAHQKSISDLISKLGL